MTAPHPRERRKAWPGLVGGAAAIVLAVVTWVVGGKLETNPNTTPSPSVTATSSTPQLQSGPKVDPELEGLAKKLHALTEPPATPPEAAFDLVRAIELRLNGQSGCLRGVPPLPDWLYSQELRVGPTTYVLSPLPRSGKTCLAIEKVG